MCARRTVVAEACALLDHAADLVVDLLRDLVGVVGLGAHVAPEERHVVVAEHARPSFSLIPKRMTICLTSP